MLLVANIRTNEHLHSAQQRLGRLTQQLCRSVSAQRVASNDQIRVPLRLTLQASAALYRYESTFQRSPITQGFFLNYADRADELAGRVTIQRGIPCEFEQAAK